MRRHLTVRSRLGLRCLTVAALVIGTVSYAGAGRHVDLVVDGVAHHVYAESPTVGRLLADRGIEVGDHDLVHPAAGTVLRDGQQVVVRYARRLDLEVDGRQRTYWTTELTVAEALTALGVGTEGARLSAARGERISRGGLELRVSTPKTVQVVADGDSRTVVSTARTVGELLAERGVTRRELDRLTPAADRQLATGQRVTLVRVEHRSGTLDETFRAEDVRRRTDQLDLGEVEVASPGASGLRRISYVDVLEDGRRVRRDITGTEVVRPAEPRVLRVGTRRRPAPAVVTGGDGLNWAALARCESGGNPKAVNPSGYYGLYQFSPATWRSVGGSGLPSEASPAEQLMRAKALYARSGAGQWTCGYALFR